MTKPILVDLADLPALPGRPLFVDTRTGPDYRRGHVPGAVHLDTFDYANERTDRDHWPQALEDWRRTFASAGISEDDTVVFYDGGLENRAARNGFMLRYLGHPRAHVLHGGMTAWVKSGGERSRLPSTRPAAPPARGPLRDEMVALVDEVARAVDAGAPVLLDVRDTGEYEGRVRLQWNPRMGRIPGAVPLDWTSFLAAEEVDRALAGTPYYRSGMRVGLREEAAIRGALADLGVHPETDLVVYCQKSHRACTVYLALERLGFRRVRVYPGSFREWSRRGELPVERARRQGRATGARP